MIIYGELLVLENLIIGAVLLSITGRIHSRQMVRRGTWKQRLRFASGSILCGLFSLVIFAGVKMPLMILLEVAFALLICMLVFNKWRYAVTFILITYFMGGITMGLLLLTKQQGIQTAVGIYTGDMKAAMLAIFIWLGYMTSVKLIKILREYKRYSDHSFKAKMKISGVELMASAFMDTGNHLRDPISGKPVAVASESLWRRMQSCGMVADNRFMAIPYETVGSRGILQAVRIDHMELLPEGIMAAEDVGAMKMDGCIIARNTGEFHIGRHDKMKEDRVYELLLSGEITGSVF